MSVAYEAYRSTKIESGKLYQDFVVDVSWNLLGLAIVQYSSMAYQQTVGESRTGVEIKHDEKYAKTGNLWIEISEKARPRPGDYAPAGINRSDNTWLYVIGDYDTLFFFQKTLLQILHGSGKYQTRENSTKTSWGFLLKQTEAERFAAVILRPNASEKVTKTVQDLRTLGKQLHEAARANLSQLSLFGKGAA